MLALAKSGTVWSDKPDYPTGSVHLFRETVCGWDQSGSIGPHPTKRSFDSGPVEFVRHGEDLFLSITDIDGDQTVVNLDFSLEIDYCLIIDDF